MTRLPRWALFASPLCIACGHGHAPPREPPSGPCHGALIDVDRIDQRCRVARGELTPEPGSMMAHLSTPTNARSGGRAELRLDLQNVTNDPLTFDMAEGFDFAVEAFNDHWRTFDTECGGLGMNVPIVRVTLEPGGVLRKKVTLDLSMLRIVRRTIRA